MKFENVKVFNIEGALRGMRNPKESWDKSDTITGYFRLNKDMHCIDTVVDSWVRNRFGDEYNFIDTDEDVWKDIDDYELETYDWLLNNGVWAFDADNECGFGTFIGPKDMQLAQTLIKAGPEHRKFMRQIMVSVDIIAPIYWWKEFDTYKVGTVANSTSTMHKLTSKAITVDSFEIDDATFIEYPEENQREDLKYPIDSDFVQMALIPYLEELRQQYTKTKSKRVWKELVRWLPESWLQKRTVTMTYENLLAMCSKGQRRFHKLNEWSGQDDNTKMNFIEFARSLPYAQEFIFIDELASSEP